MSKGLKKTTVIIIIVCIIGLSLLLYPTVSNYWNSKHSTQTINRYVERVDEIDDDEYKQMWSDAIKYNKDLFDRPSDFALAEDMRTRYNNLLNLYDGMMGYIEIPKLNVTLPVYHGTSDNVLTNGVGHVEWSSLPTGGEGTHTVLSGHRGLASAKLFTDLDQILDGDIFILNIMDETLTYEVDQIKTVLPQDVSALTIKAGCDYCTLVTCTPYGVNTHRLLVRGHRVENLIAEGHCVSEAVIIDNLIVASFLAFPILFALLLVVIFKKPAPKKPTLSSISAVGGGSPGNGPSGSNQNGASGTPAVNKSNSKKRRIKL